MDHAELLQKIERLLGVVSGEMGDESERLEGLEQIRNFIDPGMGRTTFYANHRQGLTPYLMERRDPWRKSGSGRSKPRAKFFSYKRLILLYMLRRRII